MLQLLGELLVNVLMQPTVRRSYPVLFHLALSEELLGDLSISTSSIPVSRRL